jgi:hypothetical protein
VSSIFMSLASFREPELRDTILSALENAKHPENVHFGVYSQADGDEHPDLSDIPNLVECVVPASEARGPGYARAQVADLYGGQDYFLQIDAHSVFPKDWDEKTIKLYKRIQKEQKQKKVIISFWGKPYRRDKNNKIILNEYESTKIPKNGIPQAGKWQVNEPHKTECAPYNGVWIGGRTPLEKDEKYYGESAVALGGFIFATADIIDDVPYDPQIAWHGEEFGFSLRAYTHGWKIYSPREVLLYHNYERHGNPRVWDNNPEWDLMQTKGKERIYNMILKPGNQGKFGVGSAELLKQYCKTFYPHLIVEAQKARNETLREEKRRATLAKRKEQRRKYFNNNEKLVKERERQRIKEKQERMDKIKEKKRLQKNKAKQLEQEKKAFRRLAKEEIKKKEIDNPLSSNKLTIEERKDISNKVREAKTLPDPEPQKYNSDRHR